jgi:hypothetical protein
MKRYMAAIAFAVSMFHAPVASAGVSVSSRAVLRYYQIMILATGHQCRTISSAELWATEDKGRRSGSFSQVLCDSTGPGTGFWYGLTANTKNEITKVQPLMRPLF